MLGQPKICKTFMSMNYVFFYHPHDAVRFKQFYSITFEISLKSLLKVNLKQKLNQMY